MRICTFFGALDVKINIIHSHDVLLNREDKDISKEFTKIMERKYNIFTNCQAEKISKNKDDTYQIICKSDSGDTVEISSESILVAVGRRPNTDTLSMESTGVDG